MTLPFTHPDGFSPPADRDKRQMKALPGYTRSYSVDTRHIGPMIVDFFQLVTVGLLRPSKRSHLIHLGQAVRQHGFDLRDALPALHPADLAAFLGVTEEPDIILPPLGVITSAGLGWTPPYVLLASLVGSLKPKKILEIGTFRGVSALTMALNAPDAAIITVDLPEEVDDSATATLTRGDKAWVQLSRSSMGVAFDRHPTNDRIHQIRANSLTMDASTFISDADFCFIDGGHSYECIRADTENALKVLKPGGRDPMGRLHMVHRRSGPISA